jgi:metal-dependent amidase/aminoacylase/carboxypeptidase family protein
MMAELVTFPHIEKALVSYLAAQLTARSLPAWVSTQIPADRPVRLVRVSRIGGTRRNVVLDNPTVLLECWDATELAAYVLADKVRGIVEAACREATEITAGVRIGDYSEFSGPVNFPDPATRNPRVQITISITAAGTVTA